MATKKLFFLFSILLSMVGTKALAYDFAVENADGVTIYYNYISDGKELEVTYKFLNYETHYFYSGSVVIPEEVTYMNRTRKVTSIGNNAFQGCSGLTSVTIPNSVTTIGKEAYYKCTGLTSISIGNSVTTIGNSAFRNCGKLTSVTIPNSVTRIERDAFQDCRSITSVHVSSIDAWCKIVFNGDFCNPLFYAHHLYLNGEEIKNFVIPNSVTSIGNYAFEGCSGLTSVTIPNSVTNIGYHAFYECSGLTLVSIGNSVTSIGTEAFYKCSNLTSVTIGNSVRSIGEKAFISCDLPEVISKIENPFVIETNAFSDNTFYNATLYVPKGTIDKYKATEGWKKFVFIEEGDGGGDNPNPEPQKCEKPTITFKDGKLAFSCATEGVTYQYNITASSASSGAGNNIDFIPQYTITVYATKDGYENSDTASLVVTGGTTGDLNGDGFINAADATVLVKLIMGQK